MLRSQGVAVAGVIPVDIIIVVFGGGIRIRKKKAGRAMCAGMAS